MKKRIYEYDIVRTIATLSVIVVHISAMAIMGFEAYSPHSIMTIFINRLLKFTTPVFVYLAGSLIHESYKNKPFKYGHFVISRSKRILIPYVLVSLMYYGLLTYLSRGTLSLSTFVTQTVTGSVQYHLYFIPIIIQLYLLTPVFLVLKKKVPTQVLIPLLVVVSYVCTLMMKFKYADRLFVKFMIPYIIGLYFGGKIIDWIKSLDKKVMILSSVTLVSGLFYAFMFMKYFYGEPSSEWIRDSGWFIYCILSCFTLTWIGTYLTRFNKLIKVSSQFSKISYYIYLLHPLFLALSVKIMNKLGLISTSLRLGLNLIFVITVSIVVAQIIYSIIQFNLWKHFRQFNKLLKVATVLLMVVVGGVGSVYTYNFLVDRGYIISYESKQETKRVEKMIEVFKESDQWYENNVYGFKYNYDDFELITDNEVIKTSLVSDHVVVDLYYENLEGTVHTTDTFTIYGNRSIKDGVYTTVHEDQFMMVDGNNVHVLKWSRPTLKHVPNDFNHYTSIDIIKNTNEVYNITVRSDEEIDPADYLARFEMTNKSEQHLNRETFKRGDQTTMNESTNDYYQSFVSKDSMDWGFFEPTSIKELETLGQIESAVNYDFKYLLQYYNLNSYINVKDINALYETGKILEFTLQTSVYGEYDEDVTLKMLDGYYDEELKQIIEKIGQINGPVMFRLNNEMNGDWCSYNAFFFQKDTALYQRLWTYIYEEFESAGVNNVMWLFNPNESSFPAFKWNHYSNYFPGKDFVDIIGATGYNTGDYYDGEVWRSFEEIYDEFMPEFKTVFENYPIMITEFGSSTFGGDKKVWVEEMFETIEKYDFKAAIYWNSIDYDANRTKARVYKFDDDLEVVEIFKRYFNEE